MKSKAWYIVLFAVFTIKCGFLGAGNDTLELVRKGDSLLAGNYYYEAGNYYQKAAYYSLLPANKLNLFLQKVSCLKQLARFKEAEEIISRTKTENLPDSLLQALLYQGALCSYLDHDYKKAESYLISIEYRINDSAYINKGLVLYTLILNEQGRWEEARNKLSAFVNEQFGFSTEETKKRTDEINRNYNPLCYPKLKNPMKARRMSQIIPGLGQAYSGYSGEGLGSFVICTAAVAGAAVGVYFQYYLTSLVMGNFFFGKFYTGNISRAEFLANKRNYFLINRFNEKLKPVVFSVID